MPDIFKNEYKSLDEAFQTLPQDIREHSIRTGEYMKIIFLEACAKELYSDDPKAKARLKEENWELAAEAGRYHDIGKLFVPEVYRHLRKDFSDEEMALYYRHSADSSRLAGGFYRDNTKWKVLEIGYLEEAILYHHECWDASGYPNHLAEDEIPVLARMLKVADALDNLSASVHSERPLNQAIDQITAGSGTEYAPEIVDLIPNITGKLKRCFDSHIAQTRAVPVSEPVIRRMASRPLQLKYRPITDRKTDSVKAYEAKPVFRVKRDWADYEEVAESIRKGKLEHEIGLYMVAEACDVLNRMEACNIQSQYIALEMPGSFFNRKGTAKEIAGLIAQMDQKPEKICIITGDAAFIARTKTMEENLKVLHEAGVGTMVSGNMTALLSTAEIRELQYSHARISKEMFEGAGETDSIQKLGTMAGWNMKLIADSMEKAKYQKSLNRSAVLYAVGPASGDYLEEDALIERELALMN